MPPGTPVLRRCKAVSAAFQKGPTFRLHLKITFFFLFLVRGGELSETKIPDVKLDRSPLVLLSCSRQANGRVAWDLGFRAGV